MFTNAQSSAELGDDIGQNSVSSRLVLLALHFPRLRIIWSRSLHATADIFRSLKANFEDPDAVTAAAIGAQTTLRVQGALCCSWFVISRIAPLQCLTTKLSSNQYLRILSRYESCVGVRLLCHTARATWPRMVLAALQVCTYSYTGAYYKASVHHVFG